MMFVFNIIEQIYGYWKITANIVWTYCCYGNQGVDYAMLLLDWYQ